MRAQSTPQLRDREWLNCVPLSPVILEELQEHSPYQPPHKMAQQVLVECALDVLHVSFTTTTVAGVDYLAVSGEELVFNPDDSRVCSTIHILQDSISEHDPNEDFFMDLAYVSGVRPIIIPQPTAQVVMDDSDEPECKCCI